MSKEKEADPDEGRTARIIMAAASDVVDLVQSATKTRAWFELLAKEHNVSVVFD